MIALFVLFDDEEKKVERIIYRADYVLLFLRLSCLIYELSPDVGN